MFITSILGIVQGLTEFLPVSSSGHLVLIHSLFGFEILDPAFDVFVQGGTVISLLFYFAPRLKSLALSRSLILKLIVGTAPAAILGLFLRDDISAIFASTKFLALGFFLTTLFLMSTYNKHPVGPLTLKGSLLIGLAQAASIMPSLSRSGATIATALLLGVKPESAFNFSFLMSIPLVAGASMLSLKDLTWDSTRLMHYLVGFFLSATVGYLTLSFLDRLIQKGQFYRFAPYTLILAILSLWMT